MPVRRIATCRHQRMSCNAYQLSLGRRIAQGKGCRRIGYTNHCGFVAGILARDESPAGGEPAAYRLVVATVARPLPQNQLSSLLPPPCRSVTPTCACLN